MDIGMFALFFVGGLVLTLAIVAFTQVGWFYSVVAVVLTSSIILLIRAIWKNARSRKNNKSGKDAARTVSYIAITVAAIMIVVGIIMFLVCFMSPTSHVDTFTECGWCGGSGIVTGGKICSLCNGGGGASGSAARYTATDATWLGVLIATAGLVIILGTKFTMSQYDSRY